MLSIKFSKKCCIIKSSLDLSRGRYRISGKGVHMYKGEGFALSILSHFS